MSLNTAKVSAIFRTLRSSQPARTVWLVFGIALTFLGLHFMQEQEPVNTSHSFLSLIERWNQVFHLEIVNLPNVAIGLPLVLAGAAIFASSVNLTGWKPDADSFRLPERFDIHWRYIGPRMAGSLLLFGLLLLQLGNHSYSIVSLFFWLASVLTITLLVWKHERDRGLDLGLHLNWLDGAWMLALFALGIGIGAYLLRDVPISLVPDEGNFWEIARAIAVREYQPSFFDFGVYSFPVASSIFQAWVMRLVGINLWGWRFASVLAGSLTVFPLYLLGREWFSRRAAIAACILMVTSSYYLAFARLGYNNSQAIFLVTLTIYLFALGLKRGSYFFLWLSGMAAGFGYYSYFAAWLGLVVLFICMTSLPLTARIPFRKTLPLLGAAFAGSLMIILPRVAFSLSGTQTSSMYYKVLETSFVSGFYGRATFGDAAIDSAAHWSPGQMEVFFNLQQYGILWVRGIVRSIAALFDPLIYRDHFLESGLVEPGASLFFVFGSAITLANLRKAQNFVLNAWFWLGMICLSILAAFPPRPTHTVAIIPAIALLAAFGLETATATLTKGIEIPNRFHRKLENAIISLALLIIGGIGCHAYFVQAMYDYAPDYDHTASWLARKAPGSSLIVFIDNPSVPHDAAYQARAHLTDNEVVNVPSTDIRSIQEKTHGRTYLVFIAENQAALIATDLVNLLPESKALTLSSQNGTALGYVFSNIPLDTQWNTGFAHGWRDLWSSPARYFLFAALLAMIIMLAINWSKTWTVSQIQPLAVPPADAPVNQYEKQIQWPGIEVEIRFRIQLPRRVGPNPPVPPGNDHSNE